MAIKTKSPPMDLKKIFAKYSSDSASKFRAGSVSLSGKKSRATSGKAGFFNKTYFALTGEKDRKISCTIKGFDKDLLALKVTSTKSPDAQLSFSITNDVYVLDFGERLVPIKLEGIVLLSEACSSSSFENKLTDMYDKHRLGSDTPLVITLGEDTFSTYIKGKTTSIDNNNPELLNFSMDLVGYKK